jgi:homocitrate synthase NifV
MGCEEIATLRTLASLRLNARLSVWCRARREDIEQAARCETSAVHLSVPVSRIQLAAMEKPPSWAVEQIALVTARARQYFAYVSVGAMDASRADIDFLVGCAKEAAVAGADRFRIADTVGVWMPNEVSAAITRLREESKDLHLGFHGHNDLGLATANTLAALQAGADCADVTVGGIGERAGNAALEQVVMAASVGGGVDLCANTAKLQAVCELVANEANEPIAAERPIVGARAFQHESGIHVHGILRDPRTFEPFPPDDVGRQQREILIGKHSGRAAIQHILGSRGITCDDRQAGEFLARLRTQAAACSGVLRSDDLIKLCQHPTTALPLS